MKFDARRFDQYLKDPGPELRAVLIFGADEGLVRERAGSVARAIVDDLRDPFRVAELDAGAVASDPAQLVDEAAAISMTGGRRLIRVGPVGERLVGAFESLLGQTDGDSLVVATAGELGAKSKIRKLFEAASNAAAVACYSDNAGALDGLIESVLGAGGLSVDSDAKAWLIQNLGSDRMISRQELEKLVTYMGAEGAETTRVVQMDDAVACIGDSSAELFDQAGSATMRGDSAAMTRALGKAMEGGDSAVGILRLVARRIQRLHYVASAIESGARRDAAFKGLAPPAFSREANEMSALLSRWTAPRLARALELVNEAEAKCKTTGMPTEAICARTLMQLAHAAKQAQPR